MIKEDFPVEVIDGRYFINCKGCNSYISYASNAGAVAALKRAVCMKCRVDYRAKDVPEGTIYQNADKKWCSICPSCNCEQAYTRKDHAKSSYISKWRCKKCSASTKSITSNSVGFHNNIRHGWFKRFERSAHDRNLYWGLTIEQVDSIWVDQRGCCALSGIALDNKAGSETVSLDRIDSDKGYTVDNVQLVHKVLNMMKRDMVDEDFIDWCSLVAAFRAKEKLSGEM
jgi:hypothetical protein